MTSFFSIAFWICNFCHFLLSKSFVDSGVKIAYYPSFLLMKKRIFVNSQRTLESRRMSFSLKPEFIDPKTIQKISKRAVY
jgi:exosortase/archaeosortase